MSLMARTISGVKWTVGAKVIQIAFQIGLSVVLMRMLGPKAFGLIGMVLVFSGFATVLSEFGFSEALVQRKNLTEAHRSSVFWLTLAFGLALTLLFRAAAPLVAWFYSTPMLEPLTAWLALSFLLRAPAMVPQALLQKKMAFDRIVAAQVTSLCVSGGVAVAVAGGGGGVWALVAQTLTDAAVTSGLLFIFCGWGPRLLWSAAATADVFRFGAGLTGFSAVNYWARQGDNLLIGKVLGSEALGLYARAYTLMLLPVSHVIGVLEPVLFPALSSIQDDTERVKRAYLRAMRLITFISFPLMLGLVAVAHPFVLGLLGEKWRGVIPLAQILPLAGIIGTVCNPVGLIYTSQGRTDWMFRWGLVSSTVLIGSIVIGVALGSVVSVALAYLVGNVIILYPCLAIPGRLIGMRFAEVMEVIAGNFACALSMAIIVWIIGQTLPAALPSLPQLVVLVGTGVVSYVLLAWLTRQPSLRELRSLGRRAVAGA